MEEKFLKNNQTYRAFYLYTLFWAYNRPYFIDKNNNFIQNLDIQNYTKSMEEQVLKIENSNLEIIFCRDGLIMFREKEINKKWDKLVKSGSNIEIEKLTKTLSRFTELANIIQLLLISSFLNLKNWSGVFSYTVIKEEESFFIKSNSRKNPEGVYFDYIMNRHYCLLPLSNKIAMDKFMCRQIILEKEIFEDMWLNLNRIYYNENSTLKFILNLLNSALSEYMNLNFKNAIINLWFIIEVILNKKWKKSSTFDSQEHTANDMIKKMSEIGEIDPKTKVILDVVRKKRNQISHQPFDNSQDQSYFSHLDCKDGFDLVQQFLIEEYEIKLFYDLRFKIPI